MFLAVIERTSTVFYMSEYTNKRDTSSKEEDIGINFNKCDFSWGFKIKQKSAGEESDVEDKNQKKKDKFALSTDEVKTNVLTDINLNLKKGDFVTVVG